MRPEDTEAASGENAVTAEKFPLLAAMHEAVCAAATKHNLPEWVEPLEDMDPQEAACMDEAITAFLAARAGPSREGWKPTPEQPLFDETALLAEVAKQWGPHGAHAEVCTMVVRDSDRYKVIRHWLLTNDPLYAKAITVANTPAEVDAACDAVTRNATAESG